ncbi:hypothetical protein [Natronorubrum aibiense]|uniref:Uncharacterized protein n=1 Tax=Natronorubrum aibiense TaxID=348826 RepID=A0A5P9P394_9EURY|nr:hypothetical protein [Natronorubrum aibiense]QFU82598.1 hypothetical protein GCU68_08730 [Natronorubrum aibiense]
MNPEILLQCHDRVLLTDCRTNGLTIEEVEKNSDIKTDNIKREVPESDSIDSHEIVYSGMNDLDQSFSNLDIDDPGLVFDRSAGTISKRNKFADDTLNELIHSSTIPRQIPTQFYPFSPEDPLPIIGQRLLRHLMSESISRESASVRTDGGKIDATEIASDIHDYWKLLSTEGKAQIVKKINHILVKFNERSMDEDMRKLEESGQTYYVRTSQSFRRECMEVLEELEEEEPQETLDKWFGEN